MQAEELEFRSLELTLLLCGHETCPIILAQKMGDKALPRSRLLAGLALSANSGLTERLHFKE